MAVKKPLVLTAGQIQELQSGDEINIDASDVTTGTIATARLGGGTADATTFLRGDQTWATPAGGDTTYSVTIADAENTSAKTRIISFTVPANTWSDGQMVRVDSILALLNNSGTSYTLQTWAGGTGIIERTGSAISISSDVNVTNTTYIWTFVRSGSGVFYSNQAGVAERFNAFISRPGSTHLYDDTVDFTTDITIYIDVKWSVANTATYLRPEYVFARKLQAGTV